MSGGYEVKVTVSLDATLRVGHAEMTGADQNELDVAASHVEQYLDFSGMDYSNVQFSDWKSKPLEQDPSDLYKANLESQDASRRGG